MTHRNLSFCWDKICKASWKGHFTGEWIQPSTWNLHLTGVRLSCFFPWLFRNFPIAFSNVEGKIGDHVIVGHSLLKIYFYIFLAGVFSIFKKVKEQEVSTLGLCFRDITSWKFAHFKIMWWKNAIHGKLESTALGHKTSPEMIDFLSRISDRISLSI